jgi:glycosyltransferase involved in cell wall biosynthesis
MKVLQISSRYTEYGGEEASVEEIGRSLRTHHDVDAFYGSTKEMLGETFLSRAEAPFKAIWNWKAFAQLRALQAAAKFDVWLVHNVFPGLSPAVYDAARATRVPVVQYLHNYRFGCVNGLLLNHGEPCVRCLSGTFLPAVETRCWRESRIACAAMAISLSRLRAVGVFRQVAHWVSISDAQKAIHTQFGIPAERISVLYHYYDGPSLTSPAPGRDVLFVGRLSPEKGLKILIEAWKQAGIRDRSLWIVGEGPLRGYLEELARPSPNIRFVGFLSGAELRQRWLNAAITVVPSIWEEPFGRVLLESWAHGVPVLAARIGALPELIELSNSGWLFDPGSTESLSRALRVILADESALSTAAANCHDAVSKFSKEKWLSRINSILDQVTSGTTNRIAEAPNRS